MRLKEYARPIAQEKGFTRIAYPYGDEWTRHPEYAEGEGRFRFGCLSCMSWPLFGIVEMSLHLFMLV